MYIYWTLSQGAQIPRNKQYQASVGKVITLNLVFGVSVKLGQHISLHVTRLLFLAYRYFVDLPLILVSTSSTFCSPCWWTPCQVFECTWAYNRQWKHGWPSGWFQWIRRKRLELKQVGAKVAVWTHDDLNWGARCVLCFKIVHLKKFVWWITKTEWILFGFWGPPGSMLVSIVC